MLCPTPPDRLCDQQGRPYFLWDVDLTLSAFEERLRSDDDATRAHWVDKLMRQAKPDDVLTFVSEVEIRRLWPLLERHLGRTHASWEW